MAELPSSSELVLFGGKTTANLYNGITAYSGLLNDTWKWNGTAWSNLGSGISGHTLTAPGRRYDAAMAYDGTYVTMVGGTDGNVNLSDTWSYSTGTGWFKQALTDAVDPPSNYTIPTTQRASGAARQSGEMALFGGISSFQRHYVMDTWAWTTGNPGSWMQLSPANSPPSRAYPAMASNSITVLLFGGKNFNGGLADTWTWNGTNWTAVTGFTPGITCPSARYGAMMAYHVGTSLWTLFGGIDANGYNGETWTSNAGTWVKYTGPNPPGRAFGSMAYHAASGNIILFGGLGYDRDFGDTWSWNGTTWTQLG
jgi:hypothetical protein